MKTASVMHAVMDIHRHLNAHTTSSKPPLYILRQESTPHVGYSKVSQWGFRLLAPIIALPQTEAHTVANSFAGANSGSCFHHNIKLQHFYHITLQNNVYANAVVIFSISAQVAQKYLWSDLPQYLCRRRMRGFKIYPNFEFPSCASDLDSGRIRYLGLTPA